MDSKNINFGTSLRRWAEVFMRHTMQDFMRLKRKSGLSMSQVSTLHRLYHTGECGVSDIGERLGVTNAAASQLVDRLVGLGYLERTEDPQDRRGKVVTMTAKGRALIQENIENQRRWMEKLTRTLTLNEQKSIGAALNALTEAALVLENNGKEE